MAQDDHPALVSEATLLNFVSGPGFKTAVKALFVELDKDKDGYLSRVELRKALENLRLFDDYNSYEERHAACRSAKAVCEDDVKEGLLYDALFEQFDTDGDGVVSRAEFTSQMCEIVQAIAHGLRGCPLPMLLHNESIFARAVQHEQQAAQLRLLSMSS